MVHRAGSADLPLYGGRVPKWLGDCMARLGSVMAEANERLILNASRQARCRYPAHAGAAVESPPKRKVMPTGLEIVD
jgi:hypothetical protein